MVSLGDVYHGFCGSWNGCAGCANALYASSSSSEASTDSAVDTWKSSASCENGEIESLTSAVCPLPWHGCKHEMLRMGSLALAFSACALADFLSCNAGFSESALLYAVAPDYPAMQSQTGCISGAMTRHNAQAALHSTGRKQSASQTE